MSVGVIGLGYVGLPLVVAFAEAGEEVLAVDIDQRKVDAIAAGESYIEDIPSERLRAVLPRDHRRHALRAARACRRGHHLRPDAADRQPRARPRPARGRRRWRSRTSSRRAS